MGIVIRQTLKGSLVSYLGLAIGAINVLWLYPKVLEPDEIGLLRTLIDGAYLLMIVGQLGSNNICIKYFPFFRDPKNQHHGFLFFLASLTTIGFLLVLSCLYFFQETIRNLFIEKSPLLGDYELFVIPLVLLILYYTLMESYSQSLLRIVYPKILKEGLMRILFSIAVSLVYFQILDLLGLITASVAIYGIVLALLILYIAQLGELKLKPNFGIYKSPMLKEMTIFGFYMLMGSGAAVIVSKIDTVMLSSLAGLESTGIYSIAFFIGVFIELPRRSLVGITSPLIAEAWKRDDLQEIQRIYSKTSENLLLLGLFLFLGIWFNIDSVFQLMPNSSIYSQGKYVVLFIGISKVVNLSLGNNVEIINNSKYYKWNMILMPGLALLTVVTNLWLIPWYGINGAALATLITWVTYTILRFFVVWWKLGIQPFSIRSAKSLVIFLVVLPVAHVVPDLGQPLLDILVTSAVITILFGLLVFFIKPSAEVDEMAKEWWKKLS